MSISEKGLAGSYNTKHTQTLSLSNSITRYLPKRNEIITSQEDLSKNVQSNCIHNSPIGK